MTQVKFVLEDGSRQPFLVQLPHINRPQGLQADDRIDMPDRSTFTILRKESAIVHEGVAAVLVVKLTREPW